ncbi:transcriptional repressor, blai/meci family [hydrocarbon metagenome]|uniref:Transcriptional repressor, blai/meci family n=1 Tax=hydrocarbon metagenome TaxID=938273 RepID=A0A0W8G1K9_9ZZZZ
MSENQNIKPTVAELEILQILWEKGEVTVKEVNEDINKRKETGYTTTLKTMQIMFEKGLVERKKDGRSHIYSATIKKEKTQQLLLDKILDTAFGGSASKLVMQALGNKKTTKEELQEIKELINKLERESK